MPCQRLPEDSAQGSGGQGGSGGIWRDLGGSGGRCAGREGSSVECEGRAKVILWEVRESGESGVALGRKEHGLGEQCAVLASPAGAPAAVATTAQRHGEQEGQQRRQLGPADAPVDGGRLKEALEGTHDSTNVALGRGWMWGVRCELGGRDALVRLHSGGRRGAASCVEGRVDPGEKHHQGAGEKP